MRRTSPYLVLVLFVFLSCFHAFCEQLTFRHAIELAIARSPAIAIASADQAKAQKAYQESRSAYLPNLVIGSGLGWSYGYPMSIEGAAPTIFNVNYQSTIYNPALREFLKSAKSEGAAAASTKEDQRKDAILDAALAYIQLDKSISDLKVLNEQEGDASRLVTIVTQRTQQGLESRGELTRAKLIGARVRLRKVQIEGNRDLLREHLAKLTGLPAQSIETMTESIPKLPEIDQEADLGSRAVENSLAVKAAEDRADAQQFRAKGEHRALYPSFDLAAQYGMFARFNNYEDFFLKFQRNNATIGTGIRFPIFNFAQRAKADQADAEAIKARKQVDVVKNQVSAETLRLQRAVRQLGAAQEVSELEYQLAQSDAEATQIRAEAGANAVTPVAQGAGGIVTARDVVSARIQATGKYSEYLDTTLEFDKTRLQLLRATGELEAWALGSN
jgi:outer membrane protein TolC